MAKLREIEVDFASNPGTIPSRPKESFHSELSFWQSWVRAALQKQVTLLPKVQYNNANAGELLDLTSFEVGAFKRLGGRRGLHVKPAVA